MPIGLLSIVFGAIAFFYSICGFGGGSSYIALLIISGISISHIPPIALICNSIVTLGASYHLVKRGHLSLKLLIPFTISSIPMAYLGGKFKIDEKALLFALGISLLISGIRMLVSQANDEQSVKAAPGGWRQFSFSLIIGGALGGLSGIVGIGGGIFLSPVLHFLRWGTAKQIAAISSIFILVNSLSGLVGQIQKAGSPAHLSNFLPLFIAVLIGGQIGALLCSKKLSQGTVKRLTAGLVIFAAGRILAELFKI